MLLYHSTTPDDAAAIQQHGFTDPLDVGVRFSSVPLVPDDDPEACAILAVELAGQDPDSLARFEWADPDHRAPYREWLIPAPFVNERAVIVDVGHASALLDQGKAA